MTLVQSMKGMESLFLVLTLAIQRRQNSRPKYLTVFLYTTTLLLAHLRILFSTQKKKKF